MGKVLCLEKRVEKLGDQEEGASSVVPEASAAPWAQGPHTSFCRRVGWTSTPCHPLWMFCE